MDEKQTNLEQEKSIKFKETIKNMIEMYAETFIHSESDEEKSNLDDKLIYELNNIYSLSIKNYLKISNQLIFIINPKNNRILEASDKAMMYLLNKKCEPSDYLGELVDDIFYKKNSEDNEESQLIIYNKNFNGDIILNQKTNKKEVCCSLDIILNKFSLDVGTDYYKIFEFKDISSRIYETQMNTAKQVSGAVCHETGQPFQIIMGYCQLLSMDIEKDTKQYEMLQKIQKEIGRLKDIYQSMNNINQYKVKDYLKDSVIDILESSKSTK
ncbi:hypothetical protein HN415_00195 [Candidatus Woesearchaeota archaeon]|jgi:hypothetical protein|nr:hypothetical protein [Candidatus Woesearchaeota archaeon]